MRQSFFWFIKEKKVWTIWYFLFYLDHPDWARCHLRHAMEVQIFCLRKKYTPNLSNFQKKRRQRSSGIGPWMNRWNFTSEFSLTTCKTLCTPCPGLSGSLQATFPSWLSTWKSILGQMPKTMINARPRIKTSRRDTSLKPKSLSIWWNTASIMQKRSSSKKIRLWNSNIPTKRVNWGYLDWELSMRSASNSANFVRLQSLMNSA